MILHQLKVLIEAEESIFLGISRVVLITYDVLMHSFICIISYVFSKVNYHSLRT